MSATANWSTQTSPVLDLRGLVKRFGPVTAVGGVDLAVYPGEVLGLVGDNGAGKSTLVKLITGVLQPDEGEILFDGQPVSFSSSRVARAYGIEAVFQTLALVPTLSISDNMFLGRELRRDSTVGRALRLTDRRAMRRETAKTLQELNLALPSPATKAGNLSGGQKQAVAVARAARWGGRVILMDEPSAALGVRQTRIVLDLVRHLAEQGKAVILISHNLENVLEVSTRIAVMRLGKVVFSDETANVTVNSLVSKITGLS